MPTSATILITGATDGLGLALARLYHQQGARLVLIGRRPLAELDGTFFHADNYCQVDLARQDCAITVSLWLHERNIKVLHLLIHNAATGYVGALADQTTENIRQVVNVNLHAPVALTHALLPYVEAAHGKLVFIGSVAAARAGPTYAVYTATKAALTSFARHLQIELAAAHSQAKVQIIHPGAIRTNLQAKSGANLDQMEWRTFPTPEAIAAQIAQAITGSQRTVTIGIVNRWLTLSSHHFPTLIDWLIGQNGRARTQGWQLGVKNLFPIKTAPRDPHPHCLITGAAAGIGKALAQSFAKAGYTITGIDNDAEQAMRTQAELINAGGAARFALADLGQQTDLDRMLDAIENRPPINVLIHNAGINAIGPFALSDLARQRAVIEVNLTAPLVLTATLLRQEQLIPGSSLAFISSLSHFVSYPGAAVYAASKDGIAAYARSLALALTPQQMHVLTIFPGPTRTEHARRYSPDNSREGRRMPPEQLAQQILVAVQRRRRTLIPGLGNRVFARFGHWFPHQSEQIMRRIILDKLALDTRSE